MLWFKVMETMNGHKGPLQETRCFERARLRNTMYLGHVLDSHRLKQTLIKYQQSYERASK